MCVFISRHFLRRHSALTQVTVHTISLLERRKNTSISSGVTVTNAISLRCDPGTFASGATYRSRFNQSEPSSQDATHGIDGITELVPSFLSISFDDTVPTGRQFVSKIGKQSEEHSKNTSVSFHGRASSDVISRFTTQCGAQQKLVCHVSWLHLK